jgi:IS5 family transposase
LDRRREIGPLYSDKGRPAIETRFVAGLLLLKHIYGLSDEGVANDGSMIRISSTSPGGVLPARVFHERSDLSHCRKRLGDKPNILLAESLRVAHDSGALRTRGLKRVTVASSSPSCDGDPPSKP